MKNSEYIQDRKVIVTVKEDNSKDAKIIKVDGILDYCDNIDGWYILSNSLALSGHRPLKISKENKTKFSWKMGLNPEKDLIRWKRIISIKPKDNTVDNFPIY